MLNNRKEQVMSLRDRNKGTLTTTGAEKPSIKGSLRKASSGAVARPDGSALKAVEKVAARNGIVGRANIGLIVDATASRSAQWEEAQKVQRNMFDIIGAMSLRLMHYGGNELTDHGWQDDADEVAARMAQVQCNGGQTQFIDGFRRFLADGPNDNPAKSIIMIGDSYEEEDPTPIANALKEKGIAVYAFHKGGDTLAEEEFRKIAEITGGAFAKFGPDMPLKDLCEGVALKTSGGASALNRLQNAAARQLLLGGPSQG